MSEEGKNRGFVGDHQQHHYGTFEGVPSYSQPAIGFPQPVPPSGASAPPLPLPHYYAHGYQAIPGYAVVEGRPVSERRLPCCGIGWFLSQMSLIFWMVGAPPEPSLVRWVTKGQFSQTGLQVKVDEIITAEICQGEALSCYCVVGVAGGPWEGRWCYGGVGRCCIGALSDRGRCYDLKEQLGMPEGLRVCLNSNRDSSMGLSSVFWLWGNSVLIGKPQGDTPEIRTMVGGVYSGQRGALQVGEGCTGRA
ncbi:hypothetical protein HHK36_003514 [Tetracentron sinense]|uniref:Uncharacterized protein n=1 Tax=Tetracentron sinense TaxID=13715 RepID=A0A834ZXU2_TETSI|nr:hypothetical protein HHK36_003514 [Tetracentron sinense]